MIRKMGLMAAGLAACSFVAFSAQAENVLWGQFVVDTELDITIDGLGSGTTDGSGVVLGFKGDVADSVYIFAEYDDQGYDFDVDLQSISAGIGVKRELSEGILGYASVSFESLELKIGDIEGDGQGFGLRGGVSGYAADNVWLGGELEFLVDIDDLDGLFFSVMAGYDVNTNFGTFAELRFGGYEDDGFDMDRDDIRLGVYYRF